jgi:Fe-S oxidoreductase
MRVGLFIPCCMDAFEAEVGIATLELLEKLGCTGTASTARAPHSGEFSSATFIANFIETARNGAATRAAFSDR